MIRRLLRHTRQGHYDWRYTRQDISASYMAMPGYAHVVSIEPTIILFTIAHDGWFAIIIIIRAVVMPMLIVVITRWLSRHCRHVGEPRSTAMRQRCHRQYTRQTSAT